MNEERTALNLKMFSFWTLLGPSLLFISAGVALLFERDFYAFGLAFCAIFLCYNFKKTGFLLSLLLILGVSLAEYFFFGSSLWHFGMRTSLAFAAFISFSSLGFMEQLFSKEKEKEGVFKAECAAARQDAAIKEEQLLKKISKLEEDFKVVEEELFEKKGECEAILKKNSLDKQKLEKQILEKMEEVKKLEGKITFFEGDNISLRRKHEEFSKDFNNLKMEKASLLTKVEEHDLLLKEARGGLEELNKYKGLYKELRQQFEEKDAHLHEARKELFKLQEAIAAREKRDSEQNLDNSDDPYVKRIAELEELLVQAHEENRSLNEIIQTLSH